MSRPPADLREIRIDLAYEPTEVNVYYTDGKRVRFGIDRGKLNPLDNLEIAEEAIKAVRKQMESNRNEVWNG